MEDSNPLNSLFQKARDMRSFFYLIAFSNILFEGLLSSSKPFAFAKGFIDGLRSAA